GTERGLAPLRADQSEGGPLHGGTGLRPHDPCIQVAGRHQRSVRRGSDHGLRRQLPMGAGEAARGLEPAGSEGPGRRRLPRGARRDIASRAAAAGVAVMGIFERYLTLWVVLCMAAGIGLGAVIPGAFSQLAAAGGATACLRFAVLLWPMSDPRVLRSGSAAMGEVGQHWRGVGVTVFINWAIKPFSLALLGWIFIRHVFADYLPAAQLDSYVAGLILLAAAPCTARSEEHTSELQSRENLVCRLL